jgi:hypothetical protein
LNRKSSTQSNTSRLSPEARLAIALARHKPKESHLAHARQLVAEGIDWSRMHALAIQNNVVPIFTSTVVAHLPETPLAAVEALARDKQRIRLRAMLLFSHQIALIRNVLIPGRIRFALVKGVGLSQRHYGDPFARHCQDIDILVQADRIGEVAGKLVDEGWIIANPAWLGQPISTFARYMSVIEMQSPEGVRIELHRNLDNSGLVFDPSDVLDRVAELNFFGNVFPVLSVVDEFLYVCFHHTRHSWSCLHWCADLPAMMAEPNFEASVLEPARANRLMHSTVSACVLLAQNLDAIASGQEVRDLLERSPLLDSCLNAIDRDSARPSLHHDEPSEIEPDFPMSWQRTAGYKVRFALSRCRPNLNDYNAMPLSDKAQWIYWLTRPFRALVRRLNFQT